MENKTTEEFDLVKMMDAFFVPVEKYVKTDFGNKSDLIKDFCDCCSASGKFTINPTSPLALGFFSFVSGVEYGQAQASDSKTV